VIEVLKRFLRNQMNDLADDLATGNCTNWDDYKYKTGIVFGLALVEREILEQEEKRRTADD
jgi:hypothetical protein